MCIIHVYFMCAVFSNLLVFVYQMIVTGGVLVLKCVQHFTDYGPGYELTVQAGNRKNHNSLHDLTNICRIIRGQLLSMNLFGTLPNESGVGAFFER